jgi:hypothetical protein
MADKKFAIAILIIVILVVALIYVAVISPAIQGFVIQKQIDAQKIAVQSINQIVNQQGYIALTDDNNNSVVLIDRAILTQPNNIQQNISK